MTGTNSPAPSARPQLPHRDRPAKGGSPAAHRPAAQWKNEPPPPPPPPPPKHRKNGQKAGYQSGPPRRFEKIFFLFLKKPV